MQKGRRVLQRVRDLTLALDKIINDTRVLRGTHDVSGLLTCSIPSDSKYPSCHRWAIASHRWNEHRRHGEHSSDIPPAPLAHVRSPTMCTCMWRLTALSCRCAVTEFFVLYRIPTTRASEHLLDAVLYLHQPGMMHDAA